MTCAEVRENAAEYVLGTLDGVERAALVAHLASCAACRADIASLSRVTDALWLTAPAEEPPEGFESRVLGAVRRRAGAGARAGRPWLRTALLAAAAVLLVLAGVALSPTRARTVAAGPMLDRARSVVGHAAVSGGTEPYVHVSVTDWGESGTYWVDVLRDDGTFARVAPITLTHGRGTAGGPLPVPYGDVKAVWVTDAAHTEWCSFRLASGQ